MRPAGIVGAGVLTTLVLCALVASSAWAGELGVCAKEKGGKYENKTCTTTASTAKKSKFEWEPLSKPLKFVARGGTSRFEVGNHGGIVECSSYESTGTWINAKETEGDSLVFRSCSLAHFLKYPDASCTSGANNGTIEGGPLKGKLVDHGEIDLGGGEPAEGEARLETYAEGGATVLTFTCGQFLIETAGSLGGAVSPVDTALKEGKSVKVFKSTFNQEFSGGGLMGTLLNTESDELEPFVTGEGGLSSGIDLLEKESGYPKVKLEIKA